MNSSSRATKNKGRASGVPRAAGLRGIPAAPLAILSIVALGVHPQAFSLPDFKRHLLLAVVAVVLLGRGGAVVFSRPLTGPTRCLALALLAASVSAFLSAGHWFVLAYSCALLLALVVIVLLARETFWERGAGLLDAMTLLGGVLATIAVLQSAGLDPIYREHSPALAVSTFGNTNACAAFLAPTFALAFASWVFSPRPNARFLSLLCLFVTSAALVAARSRGGWLSSGIAAMLVAGFALRAPLAEVPAMRRLIHGALACVLGIATSLIVTDPAGETSVKELGLGVERSSNLIRWSVMKNSVSLAQDSGLLGEGPGQFRVRYPAYRDAEEAALETRFGAASEVSHPHNEALRIAVDGGWLGLLIAGGLLLSILGHLRTTEAVYRGDDGSGRIAMLAAMTAFLVSSLTWSVLWDPSTSVLGAVLVGALLASVTDIEVASPRRRTLAMATRWIVVAGFLSLAAPGIFAEFRAGSVIAKVEQDQPLVPEDLSRLESAARLDRFSLDRQQAVGVLFLRLSRDPVARSLTDELLGPARACYQRALAVHPHHIASHQALAEIDVREGESDAARQHFRTVNRIQSWQKKPAEALADLEDSLGLAVEAARTRREAGAELESLIARAEELHKAGRVRDAAQILDSLAEAHGRPDFHSINAKVLRDLGDPRGYLVNMRDAQLHWALESIALGQAQVEFHLAKVEFDHARASLSRARRFDENSLAVSLVEAYLATAENDADAARGILEACRELSADQKVVPAWLVKATADLFRVAILRDLLEELGIELPA